VGDCWVAKLPYITIYNPIQVEMYHDVSIHHKSYLAIPSLGINSLSLLLGGPFLYLGPDLLGDVLLRKEKGQRGGGVIP